MEATAKPVSYPRVRTVIDAGRLGLGQDARELWSYRELLFFLSWRDVKVRYKQTLLGASWAVLQPVMSMIVFTIVFGHVAGISFHGVPYAVAVFSGMLPWTYFSQALTSAGGSVVGNAQLVSKVFFPRLIVPIASVVAPLVDLAIAFVVLVVLMAFYGLVPGPEIALMPLFVVLACVTALGVGLWFAALNVRYRDVRYALPFVVQLWLYASPVVYPLDTLPHVWQVVFAFNPMAAVIDGFRWSVLGGDVPPAWHLAAGTAVAIVAAAGGVAYFRRVEREFADLI